MRRTLLSVIAIVAFTFGTVAQNYWDVQNTGFTTPSRGITDIHAVDANIVWAVAYDGSGAAAACQEFTKTTNGGTTWTPGIVAGIPALSLAMIVALDDQVAWTVAYPPASTSTGMGIYKTTNGGTTWTRQASAAFSNGASFPNIIHMYNANDGYCMGDPINGDFEIYTTSNGGSTWTLVPGGQIVNPVSGEFGVVGYISSVGDTSWFGTNKGRIYKSIDKGHNWTAAAIPGWSTKYCTPVFKDAMNGLAQDRGTATTGALAETTDGGATWTVITGTGTVFTSDIKYVPGSPNTYVATGADATNGAAGVQYSFDGGHTWAVMVGTDGIQYLASDWLDSQTGWAGGFNLDATTDGMFVFNDNLIQAIPDFETADTALAFGGTATFTNLSTNADSYLWTFQGGTPGSSNLQTPPTIQYLAGGTYNVSLTVSNAFTTSATETKTGYIRVGFVGVDEKAEMVSVYPNPSTEIVNVKANSNIKIVNVFNLVGQMVYTQKVDNSSASFNVSNFTPGIYNVKVIMNNGSFNSKIVVK